MTTSTTTMTAPQTLETFWDRMIELCEETNGGFTLDQIHSKLAVSEAQKAEVDKLLAESALNASWADRNTMLETVEDTIKAWRDHILSAAHQAEAAEDTQRDEALQKISFASSPDLRSVATASHEQLLTLKRKYLTLVRVHFHLR